jgi:hypothetical protein
LSCFSPIVRTRAWMRANARDLPAFQQTVCVIDLRRSWRPERSSVHPPAGLSGLRRGSRREGSRNDVKQP